MNDSVRRNRVIQWRGRATHVVPGRIRLRLRDPSVLSRIPGVNSVAQERCGTFDVRIDLQADLAGVLAKLSVHPDVVRAEPDLVQRAFLTPDDPMFARQWCHATMRTPVAWEAGTGRDNVLLGFIDSGISLGEHGDLTHPDLQSCTRLRFGTDYVDGGAIPRDITGHGTAMTGIAAATGNNGLGIAGMNWASPVRICRVLNKADECAVSAVKCAIEEIVREGREHGRKIVINYSAGSYEVSEEMREAVAPAADPDVLLCCAAGNRWHAVAYPAALSTSIPGIVAIGSTNSSDEVAPSSGRGPEVTVVAPGVGIVHPFPTYRCAGQVFVKEYDVSSGTSAATALVTGLASLIWSLRTELTNVQVKQILIETAHKLAPGTERRDDWGYGRVDAAAAIEQVLSM